MRIGIPSETKTMEGRVALIPAAAADLVHRGHEVFIQSGAGMESGFTDAAYAREGITVVADAAALYAAGQLIVKVKEPIAGDLALLQKHHLLFCYLHLAAEPELTRHLLDIGLTAVAFESVTENGMLPLLLPMSVIAGRIAIQLGTTLLLRPQGGKGKLLGGMASTARGKVVVLGAGTAGGHAVALAAAAGANVVVFDKRQDRLAETMALAPNITALYAYESSVAEEVRDADIVVGAVLVPSARAPHVVTEAMVKAMEPGSVLVDIAIDQGGCFETSKPTTWESPTYDVHGVTHFCVTNMPGAVPQTSSLAISAAILPYVQRLAAGSGWRQFAPLSSGINVDGGKLVHPALQGML
ncbi:alanine dehydrogenase [Rhodanobacter thiooxydans]|uniref:alanine dehydrogenase n=1 Tax=Rhodanobacter thiooxydans TaxID=416169 RepID=A0A154QLH4_9GAMM|nr:alanine dehydrogenase [Rhodanobacter thiooxydans]EIL97571.1 alanine dehydrogenase [Rhodanobacter thiooxydans LCS2]KZC24618.1 alanine dehydrogenase [Rhodanobacter thiooxydans]MCW0200403.1 alanine dehydrogenase [Rhodanobacter thiooxydans]